MKLATLKTKHRDGQLLVVSRDLSCACNVPEIAENLQQALENWQDASEKLTRVYEQLNQGQVERAFPFNTHELAAPLPRCYQWLDGSAYVTHVELVRKARGATLPENFWTDPLMYQGGSDSFLGPCDDILIADETYGIDFEGEVAVITTDTEMAVNPEQAKNNIALVMLVNDVSLRNLIPAELAKGFGFIHGKPSTAFSPVAVTPDELADAWDDKKLNLPLLTHYNDKLFGQPNAGVDMTFDFPTLVAHAAKTRSLIAGTIIGSGTVSNSNQQSGSSCIAEQRTLEKLNNGDITTGFMRFGDRVRIEMLDSNGTSIFGAIDQKVVKYK